MGLSTHSSYSQFQIDDIIALIRMVLTNNCFQYQNLFFKQVRGTAMGSPFAPAYANIFMAHLWKTSISPAIPFRPFWLKRYIDDFVTIFPAPLQSEVLLD